ncbi:hypothetical protein EV182_003167 [Spiromyces aspiralis]|uniref:Uncharacterized protein n=1 Tax=Spiromyces aspiralis TaxID=68401 RepID=A0ACC1HYB9_9FUNG|nr:hypothetical protein EV182_003167 [Spiromyces aspiralis]
MPATCSNSNRDRHEDGTQLTQKSWRDERKERETACILPAHITNPIQRIIITASGDLQRILSALYNHRIHVDIIYNEVVPSGTGSSTNNAAAADTSLSIDRQVNLICNSKIVCRATSAIKLISDRAKKLLLLQKVAIGQLFMQLGVNPEFNLLDLGFNQDTSFYRLYSLSSSDVVCEIKEEFPAGMLDPLFIHLS